MLDKRHLTCRLHVLTLLDQQMLYNILERVAGALENCSTFSANRNSSMIKRVLGQPNFSPQTNATQ